MKKIELTKGKYALVDDEDFGALSIYSWHTHHSKRSTCFYAGRPNYKNGRSTKVYMHRVITNCPVGMQVDHIDGDGLNNQRSNLRVCTPGQNQSSRPRQKSKIFNYIGTFLYSGEWKFRIWEKGKTVYYGPFKDEKEAALARDRKALELRGEFAYLNFPTAD